MGGRMSLFKDLAGRPRTKAAGRRATRVGASRMPALTFIGRWCPGRRRAAERPAGAVRPRARSLAKGQRTLRLTPMRPERLTTKAQEALQAAQALARRRDHQAIDAEHLVLALLEQEDGIARP